MNQTEPNDWQKIILEDLAKLVEELDKKLADKRPSIYTEKRWDLPSNIINSIEDLTVDSNSWMPIKLFDNLTEGQVDILQTIQNNNKIVVNKQIRFSGVSTALIAAAYCKARATSGSSILYVCKDDYSLRKMYNLFSNFCKNDVYRDKNVITLKNNSKIRFCSEDSPVDIMGTTFDFVIIDDAQELTKLPQMLIKIEMQIVPTGKIVATKWDSFDYRSDVWVEV